MASTRKTSSKTPRGKAPRKQVAGKALKFQSSTDLVIDRLAFVELVKELTHDCGVIGARDKKFTALALGALQEATEILTTEIMEEMRLAAIHAKRVTVMERDFRLVKRMLWDRYYPWCKRNQ